jgi:hypothetical protein
VEKSRKIIHGSIERIKEEALDRVADDSLVGASDIELYLFYQTRSIRVLKKGAQKV